MFKTLLLALALLLAPATKLLADPTTAPASQPAIVDVKNTHCLVMPDDSAEPDGPSATYKGKLYHFCCKECMGKFKESPDQYIKALEADPKKYGIEK